MTPIDQVRPTQPGNWVRRPEEKRKRRESEKPGGNPDRKRNDRPGKDDRRDHQVDELA
jgi:hypothetical protein